jgi:hypothetical protein
MLKQCDNQVNMSQVFSLPVTRPRRWLLMSTVLVLLAGCASTSAPQLPGLPDRVELKSVPFFRGNAYQSGPGTLASMLANHQVQVTPGLLDKPLHLPADPGSLEHTPTLEQNMTRVAREYGFVVYPLESELRALLTQVAAGYPVMVRYSDGSAWWKTPRYATLVGYDRFKQTLLLNAGMYRRAVMSFGDFSSAWQDAGSWAVLIQGPRQIPAQVDRQRWLRATAELSAAGQEQAAEEALKSLARQGVK